MSDIKNATRKYINRKLLSLLPLFPLFLFLGLLFILWSGLFLNPIYTSAINNTVENLDHTALKTALKNTKINDQLDKSFRDILKNFRCLTCQNQNLAESTAPIAIQMREMIYKQLNEGKSQIAIEDFLVAHYGDFVLYKPAFKKETWLLWWGPVLFFLIALVFIINIFHKKI